MTNFCTWFRIKFVRIAVMFFKNIEEHWSRWYQGDNGNITEVVKEHVSIFQLYTGIDSNLVICFSVFFIKVWTERQTDRLIDRWTDWFLHLLIQSLIHSFTYSFSHWLIFTSRFSVLSFYLHMYSSCWPTLHHYWLACMHACRWKRTKLYTGLFLPTASKIIWRQYSFAVIDSTYTHLITVGLHFMQVIIIDDHYVCLHSTFAQFVYEGDGLRK